MIDHQGNELKEGDLIAVSLYNLIDIGVLKSACENGSLHYYSLNERGVAKAAGKKRQYISFINTAYPSRVLKISDACLNETDKKYYNEIMKILNKNVATADNT